MKSRILGLLAVGIMSAPAAHATNLVINGSFESPDVPSLPGNFGYQLLGVGSTVIPGWTVVGNTIQLTDNAAFSALGVYSPTGQQFVDLTGDVGQGGGLRSDGIATVTGTQYTLSFDLGAVFVSGLGSFGTAAVDVMLNGVSFGRFINAVSLTTPGSEWETQTITFTADAETLAIDIRSAIDPDFSNLVVGLDNVTLNRVSSEPGAVPEPGTLALLGLGLAALGVGRRART